jgi:hypothetical protein
VFEVSDGYKMVLHGDNNESSMLDNFQGFCKENNEINIFFFKCFLLVSLGFSISL